MRANAITPGTPPSGRLMIGALAARTGVGIETIRYYEKAGLLAAPARTSGNYRIYAPGDAARLGFIRRTRDLGFSLDEIRALIDLSGKRDRDCGEVDAVATRHLEQVDRKIADLVALRERLAAAITRCPGGPVADCAILEAFSTP